MLLMAYLVAVTAANCAVQPGIRRLQAEREMAICSNHLSQLGTALRAYNQQRGEFPRSLGALYPDYVRDANVLVCPTAAARVRRGYRGYIIRLDNSHTIEGAYMLSYRADDYQAVRRMRGDAAPLLICNQHIAAVLDETWRQAVDPPNYARRHGYPQYVILRYGGSVDRLPFSQAWRGNRRTSNDF